jgi:hypothetical protein
MIGMNQKNQEETAQAEDPKKLRKAKKNQAYATIKELVDKQQDAKYKQALTTIRPSLYGVARPIGGGVSIVTKFVSFITDKKSVSEDIVFKEFKVGRKECANIIKKHLRKVEPHDRVWIAFDANTGIYTVKGVGTNPPAGWNGYVPVDEEIELK